MDILVQKTRPFLSIILQPQM